VGVGVCGCGCVWMCVVGVCVCGVCGVCVWCVCVCVCVLCAVILPLSLSTHQRCAIFFFASRTVPEYLILFHMTKI
jgi:hypothetical protein